MEDDKPFVSVDESNGKDSGCRITGRWSQGKMIIEDIEVLEPLDPEVVKRLARRMDQIVMRELASVLRGQRPFDLWTERYQNNMNSQGEEV